MNRAVVIAAVLVTCHLAAGSTRKASAELRAHLYVDRITQIGALSTTDGNDQSGENSGSSFGEEPFWQVAILDDATVAGSDPSGFTSWTEPTCGNWAVTTILIVEEEFVRAVPDQAEAAFYVGVFDYDVFTTNNLPGTFLSEALGDHFWSGALDASVVAVSNDNDSAYSFDDDASVCGRAPTGLGFPGNWQGKFRSWYTDTDGPTAATALVHVDAGAPEGVNDDSQMTFEWTPGGDPHSGASQVLRLERASDSESCEHALAPTDDGFAFVVGSPLPCDAGGTLAGSTMPLVEGESYVALVRTSNGVDPVIENPSSVSSEPTMPIQQQGLANLLFEDGFESGGTSAWSSTSDG